MNVTGMRASLRIGVANVATLKTAWTVFWRRKVIRGRNADPSARPGGVRNVSRN